MNATLKKGSKDLKEENSTLQMLVKNKVEILSVQNDQLKCANEENDHLNQVLSKTKLVVEAVKIQHQSESNVMRVLRHTIN